MTWRTSRPWATPEETLTFCAAIFGYRSRNVLDEVHHAVRNPSTARPPGTVPGTSAALLGGASSFLTGAMFPGVAAGGCNTASWTSLACFAGASFRKRLGSDALILRLGLFSGLSLRTGSAAQPNRWDSPG